MKIILVDDEEPILRIMRRGLGEGYEVRTFLSAIDALRAIEDGCRPDAIISDVNMPVMDGVAFRERLRECCPELLPRFAFCTASHADDGFGDYVALHGVPVLSKPVTPGDLKTFLRQRMDC